MNSLPKAGFGWKQNLGFQSPTAFIQHSTGFSAWNSACLPEQRLPPLTSSFVLILLSTGAAPPMDVVVWIGGNVFHGLLRVWRIVSTGVAACTAVS